MNCERCRQETEETPWGPWCDTCGGVVIGERLFFRHVATVSGEGGRFPVVYDLSAEAYGVAWPKKVQFVPCIHCGKSTPVEVRKGLSVLDDLKSRGFLSMRGTLDQALAVIQPIARGDSPDIPEISAAPSSTEEERKAIIP